MYVVAKWRPRVTWTLDEAHHVQDVCSLDYSSGARPGYGYILLYPLRLESGICILVWRVVIMNSLLVFVFFILSLVQSRRGELRMPWNVKKERIELADDRMGRRRVWRVDIAPVGAIMQRHIHLHYYSSSFFRFSYLSTWLSCTNLCLERLMFPWHNTT